MAASPVTASGSFKPEINRRSAKFHSSVWGDYFLSCASDFKMSEDEKRDHLKLKEEVRLMLTDYVDEPIKKLFLIDSIQRLGVAYHFEAEIDEILRNINSAGHGDACVDLFTVSLKFRLLRQQGLNIPSDIFEQFKDKRGKFKESLTKDPRGLLSLYEASHVRIHGEDILDEAHDFATVQLRSVREASVSPTLFALVSHALKQPLHKGLPRLEARRYFPIYQHESSRNDVVFAFAKMDFNVLQKLHQKELSVITKWWKELDFATNLSFARDRIVECFFWILGVYYEPKYELARWIATKVIMMMSVLDDIYDIQGTPQELQLFTSAIDRWDMAGTYSLPEYMRIYYTAMLNLYQEIEDKLNHQGKSYRFRYAREAMQNQARAYFEESQLLNRQDVPTIEEYMEIAIRTTGYHAMAITCFVGMGDDVTPSSFEWLTGYPKIMAASDVITRLMDDIASYKFEKQRDHIASSVECYAKQHGVTEAEAIRTLSRRVTDGWKDVNEACLHPTPVPMSLLARILNLTRVIDVLYKNEDGYTHSNTSTKAMVSSLLVDPVLV